MSGDVTISTERELHVALVDAAGALADHLTADGSCAVCGSPEVDHADGCLVARLREAVAAVTGMGGAS